MSDTPRPQDPVMIVCVSAEESPLAIAGSITNLSCLQCGTRLLVSPASQAAIKKYPNAKMACEACAMQTFAQAEARGLPIEILDSPRPDRPPRIIPNLWRERN